MEGSSLTGDFEGFFSHAYLGSFFLDPEDVTNLSMSANWKFANETGPL